MRARLALHVAGVQCELREVVLKNKPAEMLALSPKATVPVLSLPDGRVIDESLDMMCWALCESDVAQQWLSPSDASVNEVLALIRINDELFKFHLDRYKYPDRFELASCDASEHFQQACEFLCQLEKKLKQSPFLFGSHATLADAALFPFIRQFAAVDRAVFKALPFTCLQQWLSGWLADESFQTIMLKRTPWKPGDAAVYLF